MASAHLAAQARLTAEEHQAEMDWLAFEAVLDARGEPVPQTVSDLRWRHIWPVAIVFIPFLALGALMVAALP
jgi:hypothetical protein